MQKIHIEPEQLQSQQPSTHLLVIKPKEGEQSIMIKSYSSSDGFKNIFQNHFPVWDN